MKLNPLQWALVAAVGWLVMVACCGALMSGCYKPAVLPLERQLPVSAAEHAFRELGHEPGNALAGFVVYWAGPTEYRRLCLFSDPEHSAACSSQGTTLGGRSYPRAVLRPGQPLYDADGCSVVSHEAIHWLLAKLELAPDTPWGMGSHGDRRFFGRSHPGSAEQLACAWLRLNRPR